MKINHPKAWSVTEDFGKRVTDSLKASGVMTLADTDNLLVFSFYDRQSFKNLGTFLISDNGGEFNISKPNTEEHYEIPYTNATPMTIACRVLAAIRGEEIDWSFNLSEEDSNLCTYGKVA
jgi:hypothetical protein